MKTALSRIMPAVLSAVLLLAVFLSCPVLPVRLLTVQGETLWSEENSRAHDTSGKLSEAEEESLDEDCLAFMKVWHADLALLAVSSDRYEGSSLSSFAETWYRSCGFGYGPSKDGFQMAWDTDTDEVVILAFGAAGNMVPEDYLRYVKESVPSYREKYGLYGPMYASLRFLQNYLADHAEKPVSEDTVPDPSLRVGDGSDMPSWYPKDPVSFPMYHDETAPRVTDTADIFSSEEEAAMEARLAEIRKETDRDIVIFTDVSTYGLERKVYAADFYDYNGYGCGNDREGICLFICMDPADRGAWTCCTGPVTMGLYTQEIADQIDDMLYEYLGAGQYYKGVADWIENCRRLYISGSPYTPDWALLSEDGFNRFHDADAPRVIDDADLLTEEEIRLLSEQAADLSQKYGMDFVIHTARHPGNMTRQEFSDRFYLYNGYGLGEEYDGILLTIFKRPGYTPPSPCVTASGKGSEKLTETNRSRLCSRCLSRVESGRYYDAANSWLSQTEHMLRTGRAPRSAASWGFSVLGSLLAGLIFGGISLASASSSMNTPKVHSDAGRYLVPGSLHIRTVEDTFLYSNVSKTYSPEEKERSSSSDDSSSSGSSSSSFSSSYSGSSGTTHSGSGRNF